MNARQESDLAVTRRRFIALAAATGATTLLAACTAPSGPSGDQATAAALATPVGGGTIVTNSESDPSALDPLRIALGLDRIFMWGVFDGLVRYKFDMEIAPALAEKWTQPNPQTYVFTLRSGVKFHNGREFTADDVIYNFDRYLTAGDKFTNRAVSFAADIDKVDKVDASTVRITLKKANPFFLYGLTYMAIADRNSIDTIANRPIGTGALKFKEWIQNDHLTLERNEDFWDKSQQRAATYIFKPTPDPQTMVANLEAGEAQIAGPLPTELIEKVKSNNRLKVITSPQSTQMNTITFNLRKPPFQDNVKLRQAFAYAVDRESYLKNAFFGLGEANGNFVSLGHYAYDKSVQPPARDIAKAKQLLAEAGYPSGITVDFTYASPGQNRHSQILQQQLKEVGITLNLRGLEGTSYADAIVRRQDFSVAIVQFAGTVQPAIGFQQRFGFGNNFSGYNDPKTNELITQLLSEGDRKKEIDLINQVQRRLFDDTPAIKLTTVFLAFAYSDRVQNAHALAIGGFLPGHLWLVR